MTVRRAQVSIWVLGFILAAAIGLTIFVLLTGDTPPSTPEEPRSVHFRPRQSLSTGAHVSVSAAMEAWPPTASLDEVARAWGDGPTRLKSGLDAQLGNPLLVPGDRIERLLDLAAYHHYQGEPSRAYSVLEKARAIATGNPETARDWLYTIIYFQGVTSLRRGETENCVMCRGESSCLLPISSAAIHTNPDGSRLAISHFLEYLEVFPDDHQVRWLLNVAHMTLSEHPHEVDPRFVIRLDTWLKTEFDLGRFRDIGAEVGINRLNEAGATILDDFDGDGLLDVLFTSWNATVPVVLYRNRGDGRFEDVSERAGLSGQRGGLGAAQADFDNDGHLDLFLPRGAWHPTPTRPSLLLNNGDGTFTDVTDKAGLAAAQTSDTVAWADFDNDGFVDLFVANERQPNRLFRNRGDGTFEDVAATAGLAKDLSVWKGCNWIDFDNDRDPDLFLTSYTGPARLYRNEGNGTFTDVGIECLINGPQEALSCWVWDYDNDGFLDIFAPHYARSRDDAVEHDVHGLTRQRLDPGNHRLYRNIGGKHFQNVAREAGLDVSYSAMGMNFGDFDNDGFLDFYLGTGDHDLASLVPNRLFKNVGGQRFSEITASTGTGSLQKGHGVGCGDWDHNGTVDIFIQMGGALPGDAYHNILFQNPGQGNNWLSVKLVGKQTNRSALGARIKAVTTGPSPLTVHRHVSCGSSFGGNPLEQHLGLGKVDTVATLEVHWPTSNTTQTFHNIPANRAIEITEFATDYRTLDHKAIALPK